MLGYAPRVMVEDGVQRFVAWYKWYLSRSQAEKDAAHALVESYTLDGA